MHKAQVPGFGTAGLGAVHARDLHGGVQALCQPGAAFAHAAETDDEKFHSNTLLWGSNSGTGPS